MKKTKSREFHGHARTRRNGKLCMTPTYRSWIAMRNRCSNPNATHYERYGGLGVCVCERWNSFTLFLSDMGERPPGTSLGRIGDKGNYEPGNCEWQTRKQQAKKGEQNGRAILTAEQVQCIRSLYKPKARRGCSAKNIAGDLGIGVHIVYQVVEGKTWRTVK